MEQRSQERQAADRATEKIQDVTDYVRSHSAGEMAGDTRAKAEEIAGNAKEKASQLGAQASDRVDDAMTSTGQQMNNLAQSLRQRTPEGHMGDVAESAASALERGGRYLQEADVQTVRVDLETLIRQHPVESLLIGAGLGFVLARSMRR